MTNRRRVLLGLLGPALWTGVVLLTLGTVYPAHAADDPLKAEVQRLTDELQQANKKAASLAAENAKLRAELKDEQLKNAIDVDQEVKRLRDLLRASPEKDALEKALAQAKDNAAVLEKKLAVEADVVRAEAQREKAHAEEERARSEAHAVEAKRAQAEAQRLADELARKTVETKAYEERLTQLIEQVAALK